jgi:SAM-dependent methyltransferase
MRAVTSTARSQPAGPAGFLLDIQQLARYRWAAQAVAGRDVLVAVHGADHGVALLTDAGARAVEVVEADDRRLPFPDGRFDVAVRLQAGTPDAAVLDELRRVLRPGGLLLIGGPDGGPEPDALVARGFAHSARFDERAWAASSVTGEENADDLELHRPREAPVSAASAAVVVASDAPLPPLRGVLALGDPAEMRRELERERAAHEATAERLRRANRRLLQAEQELARLPLLGARIEELLEEIRGFDAERATMREGYERSLSWRLTAPLRAAKRRAGG